jgi:hypothetical protein
MKVRKILKIYLVLFSLIFMSSVLGVAQQYKVLKIDKIEKEELFDVNIGSTDAIVYFYIPNLKDSLKFEPNIKSYLLNKKYNTQEKRWELSFAPNKFTVLVVKAPGFEPVELDIKFPSKSITEFQVYEVTSDTPAKLTIKANLPDAMVSIFSHPKGEIIAEGTLVAGTYVVDRLSVGTVRVLLEKEGYRSKDELLILKNGDELQKNWELEPLFKLVEIKSDPSGAKIFLNDERNQPFGTTPFYNKIPTGTKKLTFTKEFYKDFTLAINLDESADFNVVLERKLSKIKVAESKKIEISINDKPLDYVDGYYIAEVPLGEKRNIKVEKKNYRPYPVPSYEFVNENEDFDKLKKGWQNHFVPRNKINSTQKTVSFIVGLAGIGSGLYLMQSANKNYEAYKNATTSTEAASLRKQVESADRLAPLALAAGGVFAGIGIYFLIK